MIFHKKTVLVILILLGIFVSCNKKYFYEEYIEIPNQQWDMNDALKFTVPINDTETSYNLLFSIEHEKTYPYRNLWIFVKTSSPSGKSQIDTINFLFTDANHYWTGDCNSKTCTNIYNFANSVNFYESGDYTIEIIQGLRENTIKSINKVGLLVQQNTKDQK